MKRAVVLLMFCFLLLVPFVSAEIFISQPSPLYNLGDKLNITIELNANKDSDGFLRAYLICAGKIIDDNDLNESVVNETASNKSDENNTVVELAGISFTEVEIYKAPISLLTGEKKKVFIDARMNSFLLGNLDGTCYLRSNYLDEVGESPNFEVSRGIDVNFETNEFLYSPGGNGIVWGDATKDNGDPLDGFVEMIIPGLNIKVNSLVKNGTFEGNFMIPKNSKSGEQEIIVHAYERDNFEEIINEGNSTGKIRVKQVVKSIDIAFSKQHVVPEEELTYSVVLLDQANDQVRFDSSIAIYSPSGELVEEKVVKTGDSNSIIFKSNAPFGYWKMISSYDEFEKEKEFYVEEYEKAVFNLQNDTLVVKNIGNVPYTKPVEVAIGNSSQVKEMEIGVGESKSLKLKAPDGEYGVGVKEGDSVQELGTTFLTGRAISVDEIGGIFKSTTMYVLLALMFFLIAALFIVYAYRKSKKKKNAWNGKGSIEGKDKLGVGGVTAVKPVNVGSVKRNAPRTPEPRENMSASPVHNIDEGEKQEVVVLSLSIKNLEEIKSKAPNSLITIKETLLNVKDRGAKIYVSGDKRLAIFAKTSTGERENTMRALVAASEVKNIIDSYNSGGEVKIKYGIGINVGVMIVEREGSSLKFTSLGNTVGLAGSLSDKSNGNVLISEIMRGRVLGKTKVSRNRDGFWEVSDVSDRARHSEFVKRFLERQKK